MVSRKPIGSTRNQKGSPPVAPLLNPVLLIRWPNTKLAFWWWSGTKISSAMIAATPTTCQPTEMLLNRASSGDERMFTAVTTTRMIRNSRNVSLIACFASPKFTPKMFSP